MILSRPRLIAQERFDLEDLNVLLSAARTDSKLFMKEFWSNQNFILKGFAVSGIGLHSATIAMSDATLIIPQNSFDFSYFITAPGDPNITVPASEFTDGVRNYIELSLQTQNNTPLTRAFWDPSANSGLGAEFNQIVDTVTDLACVPVVLTGGFSGLPDRLPLAIVDVDGTGVIKTIYDRRELFFRLGTPENIFASYSWGSRVEPSYNLQLTSVAGTFLAGETLNFLAGTSPSYTLFIDGISGSTVVPASGFNTGALTTQDRQGNNFVVGSTINLGKVTVVGGSPVGTPTGNIIIDIYAASGNLPTGGVIASSDPVPASSIALNTNQDFTFSGAGFPVLAPGNYIWAARGTTTDGLNAATLRSTGTPPANHGDAVSSLDGGSSWAAVTYSTYYLIYSETNVGTLVTTATCTVGGTSSISANEPSNDTWSYGNTVQGATSGASATVSSILESFTGADKDIMNERQILSALMTELKIMKGTPFWYTLASMSVSGLTQMINSCIYASPTAFSPKFVWSGSYLQITDSNGSPLSTDVLGGINLIGSSQVLSFRRQDGQAGTTNITINDGQVLFVQLPTSGNRNYSGVGSGATNYQVGNSSAFLASDQNYWIAYRNGAVLYVRGQSELSTGESSGIGDSIPSTLLANIGLVDEVTPANYSSNIRGSNGESIVSRAGVLTDAVGDQQEDRSGYIRSDSLVTWDGTNLTFSSDIVLEFINTKSGTVTQHKILATNSPLALTASGQSIYASISRTATSENITPVNSGITPIPAQTQANKDIFVFFRRVDAGGVAYLHLPFMKQLMGQGQSVRLGQSGSGGTITKVNHYDNVSTTLPTGPTYTADGVAIANGDTVLFSNLSSGNNEVYMASGVGTSITWQAQHVFTNGAVTPADGDQVLILSGTSFSHQVGTYNSTSTSWLFNNTIRMFNGSDYWELSSINTATLADNSSGNIFSVGAVGSENIVIAYSIYRGGKKETGHLYITQNDTSVSIAQTGAFLTAYTGITFSAAISSGNLVLSYTSDSQGVGGTMKYFLQRWSDTAGGPAGPPSYTVGGGGGGTGAAGVTGDIQFNIGGGTFGADARLMWDSTNGALSLNGMLVDVLSSSAVILDNQGSPQTIFSLDQTLYRFAVVEYSISRAGFTQVGRLLITNNGTVAAITDDFVQAGGSPGVTFSVTLSGGFVLVQYMSTNLGTTGTFKHAKRRWS